MASLPQEEYQATILTLKVKLRDDDLTIEEAETLLDVILLIYFKSIDE